MAESSQNWNIEIIPGARRVRRAADWIRTTLQAGSVTELCLSEHRGAAAMLDEALETQPQLEFPEE